MALETVVICPCCRQIYLGCYWGTV